MSLRTYLFGPRRYDPDEKTMQRASSGDQLCLDCNACRGNWCALVWTANAPNACTRTRKDKACRLFQPKGTPSTYVCFYPYSELRR